MFAHVAAHYILNDGSGFPSKLNEGELVQRECNCSHLCLHCASCSRRANIGPAWRVAAERAVWWVCDKFNVSWFLSSPWFLTSQIFLVLLFPLHGAPSSLDPLLL